MTEPNSEFAEILTMMGEVQAEFLSDDVQEELAAALVGAFTQRMEGIDIPDDDEERANQMLQETILGLMDLSFKAGIYYRSTFEEVPDGAVPVISLPPEQAAQLVMGLVGNGFTFKVDRGQD